MKKVFPMLLVCVLLLCGTQALAGVMIVSSTPTYDESDAMAQNLDRAISLLNGKVIVKGQSFSFNEAVDARTAENGFTAASNGNGVSVMGGGVSQVATTLHMALKELGGDVTYEEMHVFGSAYTANYAEQAADAILTDYSRGLDYRFTSNHAENLSIAMWRAGTTVFCQLTGIGSATQAPDATPEPEETAKPEATASPEPTDESQPTDDLQTEYETMYVVNVNSHVNLRKEPSTSAEVITQIPRDAAVQFTGERQGDFLQVVYEDETGYAHGGYLSYENPSPVMLTVINCKKSVTLRKAPSTDSKKLAAIPLGETVRYLSEAENGFIKVEYNGKTGYVMGTYLTDPE